MVADGAALCATAVLSSRRVRKVPFDKGRAGDEGHVVEVDYLSRVSQPVTCAMVPGGSLVGATQTLAASLSALYCLSDSNVPSYTPILGHWDNRELCCECDGTPPERGHGSPNACMVKKRREGSGATLLMGVLLELRVCDRVAAIKRQE